LGSSQAERIETGAGNDFLNGGGGADTLVGGSGDDVYFVSQAPSTTIIELADGGTDEIRTPDASFTLAGACRWRN
jgi:serralysin